MNYWTPVTLADLAEVKHGFAFRGEFFSDIPPGGILVTPGNFAIGGGFQSNKRKYYNGPLEPAYILEANELIVTMTDLSKDCDTLGYSALVPEDDNQYLHNQR